MPNQYPVQTDDDLRQLMDILEHKSLREASQELNIHYTTLHRREKLAQRRGIQSTARQLETKQGWSPEHGLNTIVPQPLILRGTSTLYKDGVEKLQWVKTKLDDQKVEAAIRAAIDALADNIQRADPVKRPNHTEDLLCNLYPFTDTHVGMKSWAAETGADWDLEIAERTLISAFDYLIEAAPPAKTGIVLNLGDFLHYDSLTAVTPTNQHPLDADSRYSKMVKVAIKILRYIVDKSLTKHEDIIVIMSEGNHDPASAVWLRHMFSILYENEPRVKVLDSEMVYTVHKHGKTMLAFHHGHMSKMEQLPLLFAAQYPQDWGCTEYRYCHIGHQHHTFEKEFSGMTVRQHGTLAARDAYASRGGWVAARQIEAITYHSEYGKVATVTCVPDMLR